jgi:LuxR family maltose regulon positive regulatory protein
VAFAVLQAAHVAYQRLEHAACGELAGWALAVAGANAEPTVRMSATALCAAVDVHEGADPSEAARRLRNCWSMAGDQPTSAVTTIRIAFAEHRCGWLTGHPEWAREALQRLQDGIGAGGDLQVLTATEHLVRGRGAAARRCVRAVLEDGEACVLPTSVQQAWLIEAVVADDVGETACSHEALRAALVIAEEFDVQHAFLDVPGAGRLLDENSRRFGRLDAVSERIRSAVAAEPGLGVSFLTPREVDVLTDLPSQLTLDEIAQRQQVSLNTVKTHVRAIYQKLDAGSRREAVVSARRRGLL